MNMQISFLLAVLFTNLIIAGGFISAIYLISKKINMDSELKEKMFMFSLPINDEDNLNILDMVIKNEMDVYTIYNFPAYSDDLYISEDDQNKMIVYILKETLRKMSPVYISKLEFIYNKEVLEDIIYGKIRDMVLSYTIEVNGSFSDLKTKKNIPVG